VGYSQITLTNYSRWLAQMAQYFNMIPILLSKPQAEITEEETVFQKCFSNIVRKQHSLMHRH